MGVNWSTTTSFHNAVTCENKSKPKGAIKADTPGNSGSERFIDFLRHVSTKLKLLFNLCVVKWRCIFYLNTYNISVLFGQSFVYLSTDKHKYLLSGSRQSMGQ